MKEISLILFLGIVLGICSCGNIDEKVLSENSSYQEKPSRQDNQETLTKSSSDWKKLSCGLFISSMGELGFASLPKLANIPLTQIKSEECPNVFITTLGSDHTKKLSDIIDTNTFVELGAGYFKDRNNIYNHYAMCDGGYLNIFSTDTATFKVLGCCYASYKNKIYHSRNGLMNADAKTFKTSYEIGPAAKDKNGFFSFEEKTTEEQLKLNLGDSLFKKLIAL